MAGATEVRAQNGKIIMHLSEVKRASGASNMKGIRSRIDGVVCSAWQVRSKMTRAQFASTNNYGIKMSSARRRRYGHIYMLLNVCKQTTHSRALAVHECGIYSLWDINYV